MRRVKWGIGAVVVVGLAWLISNVFNMGGLGTGEGARIGLPVAPTVPVKSSREEPPPQEEPVTEPVAAEADEPAIGTGGVVEVLIDDRDYFLRRGTGDDAEWVAAEPKAIAGFARQAQGDETGSRVRVFRKGSARAASEDELRESLRGVGLTDAEIDWPEKFVE